MGRKFGSGKKENVPDYGVSLIMVGGVFVVVVIGFIVIRNKGGKNDDEDDYELEGEGCSYMFSIFM